jgi:hypothetical protein
MSLSEYSPKQGKQPDWSPYPEEIVPASPKVVVSTNAVADMLRMPVSDRQSRRAGQPDAGFMAQSAQKKRQPSGPVAGSARNRRPVWVTDQGPSDALNAKQYVRELDRFAESEGRKIAQDTLVDVQGAEIEGLARLAAAVRGRYLAKLLDLGGAGRPSMRVAEMQELKHYREMYEEISLGLDALKAAIEVGDVKLG